MTQSANTPEQLEILHTEQVNPATADLDTLSTLDMVRRMNQLDCAVPFSVGEAAEAIAQAVDLVADRLRAGGRLVYVGAGTSGRLGFMDAAECPPTFGVAPDRVSCIIAGGRDAVFQAKERVEDDAVQAGLDLAAFGLSPADVVLALASSGRTPYCIGALQYAAGIKAARIALSCNKPARLSAYAEVAIEIDSGAEAIMGSTRLKAGTAQKMVLNMISTLAMLRCGHVYKNLMVNVRGFNTKLNNRMLRIFAAATGNPDLAAAEQRLAEADGSLKTAIVMELAGVARQQAEDALARQDGFVRAALIQLQQSE
jgi:N-acetylmuramic acid 6-phosphate etherase